MEQNQIPSQPQSPAPQAPPLSPEPKIIGHAGRSSSNRPIFLLVVLLIVILVFSVIIIRNNQGQQEQIQNVQIPPRQVISPTSIIENKTSQIQEEKDLQSIDVSSDDADIQSIRSDLQGL